LTTIHAKRMAALAFAATMLVAACGGSAATTAPSAAASAAASSGPAASGSAPAACVDGSITTSGSTALQPLVDAAGKAYVANCPKSTISVQGGGSGTGLTQVSQGAVQIGASDVTADSKLPADQAAALVNHIVARQGWVMVVNSGVTGVTSLTTQQAQDIWSCPAGQTAPKITNWKQVGGPDVPIVLVLRPASSGTRATFKKLVLNGVDECAGQALTEDSNGAVTTAIGQTAGATSVIGFAYYAANSTKVAALGLDGVQGSVDNMANNTYKLQANGNLYTKGQPDGLTKSFLDYMMSDYIQKTLIPANYYGPAPAQ